MENRGESADAELQLDADFVPVSAQVTLNIFFRNETLGLFLSE